MNDNVKSAARVLDILELLFRSEEPMALRDLVSILALPKSSAHALLRTLQSRGYVERDAADRYALNEALRQSSGWIGGPEAQLAAVAPYELDGRSQAVVQVVLNGQPSNTMTLPVAASAPGIFTADASGTGPAAATTAPAGGVITLYLTGEGQTSPAGVTGKVTALSTTTPVPLLPVSILIGGLPTNYTFAGEAPGVVSGVLQLNVTVPQSLQPGTYPILVSIGGKISQSGVTVTVTIR